MDNIRDEWGRRTSAPSCKRWFRRPNCAPERQKISKKWERQHRWKVREHGNHWECKEEEGTWRRIILAHEVFGQVHEDWKKSNETPTKFVQHYARAFVGFALKDILWLVKEIDKLDKFAPYQGPPPLWMLAH
jgi:hypothetical protein